MMPALLCMTILPGARRSTAGESPGHHLPSLWCSRAGRRGRERHAGQGPDRQQGHWSALATPDNFTIFEGTSEIQRMIIGRTVTGLPVR
jgi:hypothetical protein